MSYILPFSQPCIHCSIPVTDTTIYIVNHINMTKNNNISSQCVKKLKSYSTVSLHIDSVYYSKYYNITAAQNLIMLNPYRKTHWSFVKRWIQCQKYDIILSVVLRCFLGSHSIKSTSVIGSETMTFLLSPERNGLLKHCIATLPCHH